MSKLPSSNTNASQKKTPKIPEKLPSIIRDFTRDLSATFPEYVYLWEKWTVDDLDEQEIKSLFEYFLKTYPARFFDILYQNEDIFKITMAGLEDGPETNTFFLPNVEFKLLYHCDNITEKTKQAIWKYLQLILFTLTDSIKDKGLFGDTAKLFDGIKETDLQEKLTEVINGMGDFFKNSNNGETETEETSSPNLGGEMPNPESIFENLSGLLEGKIGKMAQELAQELSGEFGELFGEDGEDADSIKNPQDAFKKLMKNPSKMMGLVKKVSEKIKTKFDKGDINPEDMKEEMGAFMNQMKSMGGPNSSAFQDMMKNMAKSMGLGGKNMKMDTNALSRMEKQMNQKEQIKARLEKRKTEAKEKLVFRTNDGEIQEKSMAHQPPNKNAEKDVDTIMREFNLTNESVVKPVPDHKKKKKAKK